MTSKPTSNISATRFHFRLCYWYSGLFTLFSNVDKSANQVNQQQCQHLSQGSALFLEATTYNNTSHNWSCFVKLTVRTMNDHAVSVEHVVISRELIDVCRLPLEIEATEGTQRWLAAVPQSVSREKPFNKSQNVLALIGYGEQHGGQRSNVSGFSLFTGGQTLNRSGRLQSLTIWFQSEHMYWAQAWAATTFFPFNRITEWNDRIKPILFLYFLKRN